MYLSLDFLSTYSGLNACSFNGRTTACQLNGKTPHVLNLPCTFLGIMELYHTSQKEQKTRIWFTLQYKIELLSSIVILRD